MRDSTRRPGPFRFFDPILEEARLSGDRLFYSSRSMPLLSKKSEGNIDISVRGNTLWIILGWNLMAPSNHEHGFDLESVLEDTGLDREDYMEIYELFKESFAELMQELEVSVASDETGMVKQAAHTLKGICSNIGFMDLARIAQMIQENPENMELAAESIPEMRALYAKLDKEIQAIAGTPA